MKTDASSSAVGVMVTASSRIAACASRLPPSDAAHIASRSRSSALSGWVEAISRTAARSVGTASTGRPRRISASPQDAREVGSRERLVHQRRSPVREHDRVAVGARDARAACCAGEAAAPRRIVVRQVGGALECLRGRHVRRSALGALGGGVERPKHRLVVLDRRVREVPGTAVGVRVIFRQHVGERAVHAPALARGGRLVQRRPDEGMPELAPNAPHDDQTGAFCGVERSWAGTEHRRGASHESQIRRVVRRRHEQHLLCLRREPANAFEEHALDVTSQR